jgi:hypothetical protein
MAASLPLFTGPGDAGHAVISQTSPELLLLLVVLTNFTVLGTTRQSTCIRALAIQ